MTQTIGSRRQVWNGTSKKTSGGLTKSDLMMSHGRIVSKAKHFSAKKEMRLLKYGYGSKKGKFGYVKLGTKKHRGKHKKMRGGMSNLSPSGVDDSYMIKDVVPQNFSPLARALVGGRSRSRSRGMAGGVNLPHIASMATAQHRTSSGGSRMAGGSGYGSPLNPAEANSPYMINDVVPQSFSPLDRALVGGRRKRKMRGGNKDGTHYSPSAMRGGTTSHRYPLNPSSVEENALLA